jgi:hypothetical protein
LILIALVMGLQKQGIMFHQMAALVLPLVAALGTAIVAGCILHPVLLPFLFVRSFAFQGLILGILADILAHFSGVFSTMSIYGQFASYIAIPALSSYLAFNFTGSTPIANKSGVKKELKLSVPLYIAAGVATLILLVLYKISQEGLL